MAVAVIPVRSFRLGKKRLAPDLNQDQRLRIGRAMTERVLEEVAGAGLLPRVVTADDEVLAWATGAGIETVRDPGFGLNSAAAVGVASVSEERWVVIHSDLPLVRASELSAISTAITEGRDVIAPSSDGGTSAISARDSVEFAYGKASFHRHLPRLVDPVVVVATGLLHDLDSPGDLESAVKHRHGRWLDGIY